MTNDDALEASLRSTLVVGMADAAGIRFAPNGEGGMMAALDVDTSDGKWRFVLPSEVFMFLVAQCAALASLTREQNLEMAAELHQEWLESQGRAPEGDE